MKEWFKKHLVNMKNGKIAVEQDFMDFLNFYKQLGIM